MNLPQSIINTRKSKCSKDCVDLCDHNNPCASCKNNYWGPIFCDENIEKKIIYSIPKLEEEQPLPSKIEMSKSFVKSMSKWIASNAPLASEDLLSRRKEICSKCEFWNPKGFKNTGRCMKCGCSTWTKLRMATEKCPIGKW